MFFVSVGCRKVNRIGADSKRLTLRRLNKGIFHSSTTARLCRYFLASGGEFDTPIGVPAAWHATSGVVLRWWPATQRRGGRWTRATCRVKNEKWEVQSAKWEVQSGKWTRMGATGLPVLFSNCPCSFGLISQSLTNSSTSADLSLVICVARPNWNAMDFGAAFFSLTDVGMVVGSDDTLARDGEFGLLLVLCPIDYNVAVSA